MNPEESRTPEPIDEWLEQIQEQKPSDENPDLETAAPTPEADDVNQALSIFNPETADSEVELTQESDAELAENTTLGLETEPKSQDNSLYTQAEQRIAQLQNTEAALSRATNCPVTKH